MIDPNVPKNYYSQPASNEQTFYDAKENILTIGDRVVIKAGGLSGKIGVVDEIVATDKRKKTYSAIVSSPNFGMPQTVPLVHLEKAS
jgi:phosphoribosylamine-glycine ligase